MKKSPEADYHHILFNRQEWSLRDNAKQLRENSGLIPFLDREVHNELHRQCPPVPLLGHVALFRTLREYQRGGDAVHSLDNLMMAVEISNLSLKAHPIERQLGALTIAALELQRPFIKEGLVDEPPRITRVAVERTRRATRV